MTLIIQFRFITILDNLSHLSYLSNLSNFSNFSNLKGSDPSKVMKAFHSLLLWVVQVLLMHLLALPSKENDNALLHVYFIINDCIFNAFRIYYPTKNKANVVEGLMTQCIYKTFDKAIENVL